MTLGSSTVSAQPSYSDVFFFGTSALDTGNWLLNPSLSSHPLAPTAAKGYFNGRWQSGPSFSDYLALALGHDATPSLAGGQNYAYGVGWVGPLPGEAAPVAGSLAANPALYLGTQVNAALSAYAGVLPSNALYVIAVGGNDADFFGRPVGLADDVANLAVSRLQQLVAAGARSFLVQTLGGDPLIPSFATTFNQTLLGGLGAINGIQLTVLDTRAFNQTVVLAPGFLGSLGITDFGNCLDDAACKAAAIAKTTNGEAYYGSTHFLFDDIHRDTKVSQALANYAIAQLPQRTVPEPGTVSLLVLGLVSVGLLRRTRR